MQKEITLGNLLGILTPIFVLIIGWGISVNTRMAEQDTEIKQNKKDIDEHGKRIEKVDDKIDKNFKLVQEKLDRILYHEINTAQGE